MRRFREPTDDRVEVPAVGLEVDLLPVRGPVVLGGQVVGQRLQPPEQMGVVAVRIEVPIAWLNCSPA